VFKRYPYAVAKLYRDEHGLTAAETVIVVLSLTVIVVASIYILFAGSVFSAEKSQGTILGGIAQVKSDLELLGSVTVKCVDDTEVRYILFTVRNNSPENPTDMVPYDGTGDVLDKTVINLSTSNGNLYNVKWTSRAIGAADNDGLLELGEQFELTIDLRDLGDGKSLTRPLGINSEFTIQLKPAKSSALLIRRTIPASLQDVIDLY
jgi:archaellin